MHAETTWLSGRMSRRAMTWLVVAVIVVTPLEALGFDHPLVLATMPLRVGLMLLTLWGLRTQRISPIIAGRLFLAQAVLTMVGWAVLLEFDPHRIVVQTIAYGTILPISALLIAPRESRRAWALLVLCAVLYPAFVRLLPGHAGMLAQILATLFVHTAAVAALDAHADKAELAGELAGIDALTGLYNRRSTLEQLHQRADLASTRGVTSSLLLFDLDHFKRVNDTLGHEAGDDALRRVADTLTQLVRPIDCVCRWGGEEFIVVLPDTDSHAAAVTAESLRVGIETTGVTASFGVAEIDVDDTVTSWVRRADDAMYDAKRVGRNRVIVAASSDRSLG